MNTRCYGRKYTEGRISGRKLNKGIVKGTGKWTIRTGKITHYE